MKINIEAKDISYIIFYPSDPDYKIFAAMKHAVIIDEGLETEYCVFYTIPESVVASILDIKKKSKK